MPRIFISYSHDSEAFKQLVLGLANKLRDQGVDAWIDQYLPDGPREGWPRWMAAQIEQADFVLLVCTEIYSRRVSVNEEPGKGLGAVWESHLVFQHLYNAGTVNPKFIPVLPPGGEVAHIPTVLGGVQRYYPFSETGYQELYRRLTGQPAVQVPALGNIVVMPPLAGPPLLGTEATEPKPPAQHSPEPLGCRTSQLGLIATTEGVVYIPVKESHWDGREATLLFEPDEAADGSVLDNLRDRRRIRLAYKNNAALCSAQAVQQRSRDGVDQWQITFRLEKTEFGGSMEFQSEGLTPDQAAVLRAQRLLLNDHPPLPETRNMSRTMREIMIRGQQVELEITQSPFPELFRLFGGRPVLFLEIAWITAMLQLKMSATVEQVSRFELTLIENRLQVEFGGRRRKIYSNMPAPEVKVSGTCTL